MRKISKVHEGPGRVINNRDMVDGSSNIFFMALVTFGYAHKIKNGGT